MKLILVLILLVAIGWVANYLYIHKTFQQTPPDAVVFNADTEKPPYPPPLPKRAIKFTCDGRTHCTQMTSCEEATYFISHCPGTKMDGDNDGVPCEKQWCN